MHAVNDHFIAKVTHGTTPADWGSGDERFMKAKVLAAIAWHEVKMVTDPELPACDLSHQETLVAEVESVLAGNSPSSLFGIVVQRLAEEMDARQAQTIATEEE